MGALGCCSSNSSFRWGRGCWRAKRLERLLSRALNNLTFFHCTRHYSQRFNDFFFVLLVCLCLRFASSATHSVVPISFFFKCLPCRQPNWLTAWRTNWRFEIVTLLLCVVVAVVAIHAFFSHLGSALCYFYFDGVTILRLSVCVCNYFLFRLTASPIQCWAQAQSAPRRMNELSKSLNRSRQHPAPLTLPCCQRICFLFPIRFFSLTGNACASECGIWDTLGRILVKSNGNSMRCWGYVDCGRYHVPRGSGGDCCSCL